MAITITKTKKESTLPKVESSETMIEKDISEYSLEELADAYGSLKDQIDAILANPIFTRFDLVEKELKERLKETLEPTDSATIQGEHWVLEVSPCGRNPRKLKPDAIPKIQAYVGNEVFYKIAKVNISDCEKYLTPQQLTEVLETDTGFSSSRKIVTKFLG